jgi:urease accessory protein
VFFAVSEVVLHFINTAQSLDDNEIGASLPRMAMAGGWHESQYTRLFCS